MSEEKQTDLQEKQEQETEEKTGDEKKWDAQRQIVDQEVANRAKAEGQRDALAEQLETNQAKLEEAHAELSSLRKEQAAKQSVALADLDDDLVTPGVRKNFDLLAKKVTDLENLTAGQAVELKAYKDRDAEQEAKKQKRDAVEGILKPMDAKYGAQHRTAAKKLADDKVKSGEFLDEDGQPRSPTSVEAIFLMQGCYEQVKRESEEKEKSKESEVPTDTGFGGISFGDSGVKEGTREEVLADMKKSWGKRKY